MRSCHSRAGALAAPLAVMLVAGCEDGSRRPEPGTTLPRAHPVLAVAGNPADGAVGRWDPLPSFPAHVAIHATLLPNGRVLFWPGEEGMKRGQKGYQYAFVWDPVTTVVSQVDNRRTNVFCSGHTLLADGRVFVAGGHIADGVGAADVNIFDGATGRWSRSSDMAHARWYPTTTLLPNGDVLTIAGTETGYGDNVPTPEVWQASTGRWRQLTGIWQQLPYYPWMFVTPTDGRVFYAGSARETGYLDPSGAGSWSPGPAKLYSGGREYGSAVMYDSGKVLVTGGSDGVHAPTSTAEVIDLAAGAPAWRSTASMTNARRHMNLTILPDGRVLATGGTSTDGFNSSAGSVYTSEVWDPAGNGGAGAWTTWSSMTTRRLYHSTALLLPDGRVLSAGGGRPAADPPGSDTDHPDAELFSPPYLFDPTTGAPAHRPEITSAPTTVSYGSSITVTSPDAAVIARATWIRLGSVTHTFNMSQRFLSRVPTTDAAAHTVTVAAPANARVAPPGHYMLFLIDANGVPSIAKIVQVR